MVICVLMLAFSHERKENKSEVRELRGEISKVHQMITKIGLEKLEMDNTINELTEENKISQSEIKELKETNEKLKVEVDKERAERKKIQSATRGTRTSAQGRLLGVFESTAYTDNRNSQGKWVGQTATGMKPQVGVVAVDPNVIPLGTKLFVEGYGNCVAGDTGGAIKGRIIDVFKNTSSECKEWGRRSVKVYIRE